MTVFRPGRLAEVTSRRDALGVDPNAVPRAMADDSKRPQRVVQELAMAKVTRAISLERQLQQVMDDFWFNHFNVYAGKGEDKWYLTSYERDVIQPHALGKFKDLVTETAKSPAMLFYLDNFLSADPRAAARSAAQRAMRQQMRRRGPYDGWASRNPPPGQGANKKQERGLNENYGRELMELHTLGVDTGGGRRAGGAGEKAAHARWAEPGGGENSRFAARSGMSFARAWSSFRRSLGSCFNCSSISRCWSSSSAASR